MLLIESNIAQSFQSPIVRVLLGAIGIALLYVLWREVQKIPAKLFTLMATAFVDMVGLLMIIPLLPFYVKTLGGAGIDVLGMHFGIGIISGFIIAAFTVAQLLSAPMWGRFSDRVRCIGDCVSDFRFRTLAARPLPLAHSAGSRRRHSRRDPGLRGRLD